MGVHRASTTQCPPDNPCIFDRGGRCLWCRMPDTALADALIFGHELDFAGPVEARRMLGEKLDEIGRRLRGEEVGRD